MASPPVRPSQVVGCVAGGPGEGGAEQAGDFVAGQRDETGRGRAAGALKGTPGPPGAPVMACDRAPGSPRCSITQARRSSRTPSASHFARARRCCIPSGDGSPACSAMVHQFLRGSSASSPRTNARALRRGSTLQKRPPTRTISSSSIPGHRSGSTLWPAASRRSSPVVTNRDDQTVAAPVSSTDTPKITNYGWSTSRIPVSAPRVPPWSRRRPRVDRHSADQQDLR